MSDAQSSFTGKWLHTGSQRGQDFSHHADAYDHPEADGATPMRHAQIEQEGQKIGVWVPADWSDDQARSALESNW